MASHRLPSALWLSLPGGSGLLCALLLSASTLGAYSLKLPDNPPCQHDGHEHWADPPGNDLCQDAEYLSDQDLEFSTRGASTDGPPHAVCQFDGQVYNDIWYRWNAPLTGMLWISLCDSEYDTDLAVYDGWQCPVDDSRLLGCNDDACPGSGSERYRSRLAVPVEQGQDLLLRLGGYGQWDRGDGRLELSCQALPDGCVIEEELQGPDTIVGNTSAAWQLGHAQCGWSDWSPALIYRFQPACPGPWQASLCGSGFDTVLSVHTACPPDASNQLACNDDACGLASQLEFTALADNVYWLRVSGYNGASGAFVLDLDSPVCGELPPLNDECAQAQSVGDGNWPLSTLFASPDGPDQPGACGLEADSSLHEDVWFLYTASCTGTARFDLCDGNWDSLLAVYPAGQCPPAADSLLACNDDSCGMQSCLELPVSAGQQLLVRVGGHSGERGTGTLGIQCLPDCQVPSLPAAELTIRRAEDQILLEWPAVVESLEGCPLAGVEYRVWGRTPEALEWQLLDCVTTPSWTEPLDSGLPRVQCYRVSCHLP
ncbi:MAG: hypothetical protein H6678_01085 [Candidatus Delongbacteria bacterium]|nr:hypothetical protein [Candidatus Cloacimonadota bacterium]MCB9472386.1 hypothetical protein [Candidatus Delongbacteria bacterium]